MPPELIAGSKTADVGVKNAMMKALQEVVGKAGGSMSEASKNSILALIDDDASDKTGKPIWDIHDLAVNLLVVHRCGGYDKCKTTGFSCQGSPTGDCNTTYQVCPVFSASLSRPGWESTC